MGDPIPPYQPPTQPGSNGVFITTREIYDALVQIQRQMASIEGKMETAMGLEERVRKVEVWAKALPVSLILFVITLALAILQLNRNGGL